MEQLFFSVSVSYSVLPTSSLASGFYGLMGMQYFHLLQRKNKAFDLFCFCTVITI